MLGKPRFSSISQSLVFFLLSSILIHFFISHAHAAVEYGIAANYPGDAGIENAPGFVFRENFEEASIAAMTGRWEDFVNQNLMSFNADKPSTSAGSKSVFFNGEAHLYRRLLPGYDQLYVRFYVKFDPVCSNIHHFVHMGGYNPTTRWPQGGAGTRPAGNERWTTGIEPNGTSWAWDFYSYWMHMRSNPDTNYWGNSFSGRPSPYTVIKNEWISVEFMVKMNNPVSAYNGEQAFWINGEKKVHLGQGFPRGEWIWDGFYPKASCTPTATCNQNGSATPCCQDFEGFQWRNTTALNINFLWLLHYVDTDPSCTVKFDDVVVATQYIGPMVVSTIGGNSDNSSGGSSGGSGCGYIKDNTGKGQGAKGEGMNHKGSYQGLAMIIMLIITLAGIAIARRLQTKRKVVLALD